MVLRATGRRVSALLGQSGLVARLGGEELAVFLPGQTADAARATARRLCEVVRAEPFAIPGGGFAEVTASVGGTWNASAGLELLMARADAALYAAKHAGRDRCRFASEQPALADGAASGTESACADCPLRHACCGDREGAPTAPSWPERSVA